MGGALLAEKIDSLELLGLGSVRMTMVAMVCVSRRRNILSWTVRGPEKLVNSPVSRVTTVLVVRRISLSLGPVLPFQLSVVWAGQANSRVIAMPDTRSGPAG
jgi:hypothetical protein